MACIWQAPSEIGKSVLEEPQLVTDKSLFESAISQLDLNARGLTAMRRFRRATIGSSEVDTCTSVLRFGVSSDVCEDRKDLISAVISATVSNGAAFGSAGRSDNASLRLSRS